MMLLLAALALVWLVALLLVLAICRAAAVGDAAQESLVFERSGRFAASAAPRGRRRRTPVP